MRAQRLFKMNVARLVEGTDQPAGVGNGALHRGAVARIGAQISRAQIMRREHRRAAGEIEDQVAGRGGAVARRPEQSLAREEGSGSA